MNVPSFSRSLPLVKLLEGWKYVCDVCVCVSSAAASTPIELSPPSGPRLRRGTVPSPAAKGKGPSGATREVASRALQQLCLAAPRWEPGPDHDKCLQKLHGPGFSVDVQHTE